MLRWSKLMLMTRERRPAFRTIEGWARGILLEADAIRECETHGWMQDRADPHARESALDTARLDMPGAPLTKRPHDIGPHRWTASAQRGKIGLNEL